MPRSGCGKGGALDVYTVPIGMKKSRPGVLLACLCREEEAGKLTELILRHTTTLGVRCSHLTRTLRPHSFRTVQTPWGPVTVKETPTAGVNRNTKKPPPSPAGRASP